LSDARASFGKTRGIPMTRIIATAGLLMAAACSTDPVYRTNTSYIAPASVQGNSCVASCETTEQICKSRAEDYSRAEYPACMQRVRATYNRCMSGVYTAGCDLARQNAETSCSYEARPDYRGCTASFNSCYSRCGGQVIKKNVCVKNCDG